MSNAVILTASMGKLGGAQVATEQQVPWNGDGATTVTLPNDASSGAGFPQGVTASACGFYFPNDGSAVPVFTVCALPYTANVGYAKALATSLQGASPVGFLDYATNPGLPHGNVPIMMTAGRLGVDLFANPAGGTAQGLSAGGLAQLKADWDAVTDQDGGLTPGAYYYISATTPGHITSTPPSDAGTYTTVVGFAIDAITMRIQFGLPVANLG